MNVVFLKMAQKFTRIFGLLLKENLLPRSCKIAQSGHSALESHPW